MAKKKEKGKQKKDSANAADALREAVERTFAGAAGGAAGAQKRAQELFDDVTSSLTRLREAVDERRVLDTLESLRDQVETLARRVSMLERGGGDQGAATSAPAPAQGAVETLPSPSPAKRTSTRASTARKTTTTSTKRSASPRS